MVQGDDEEDNGPGEDGFGDDEDVKNEEDMAYMTNFQGSNNVRGSMIFQLILSVFGRNLVARSSSEEVPAGISAEVVTGAARYESTPVKRTHAN